MARAVAARVRSRRRRGFAVGAAVLAVVAALLAVLLPRATEDGPESLPPPSEVPPPPAVLPLLGTPGRVPERAALAVKIDDTEQGRPQSGLAEADVVFEEMVEGGLTRLLAVYQSRDPGTVGPVRSARSTDLSILAELGRPLFAWSGANPTFAAAVRGADIVDVGFGAAPDAYRRASGRPAPYNLYAAPGLLRDAAADDDARRHHRARSSPTATRANRCPAPGPRPRDRVPHHRRREDRPGDRVVVGRRNGHGCAPRTVRRTWTTPAGRSRGQRHPAVHALWRQRRARLGRSRSCPRPRLWARARPGC